MIYNQGPSVIETYPSNYGVGIPVDAQITIKFDYDVAKTSIADNVHLYNKSGVELEVRFTYADKLLTITPRETLQGDATYRVVVQGDNDPENTSNKTGICSPLGSYMLGDYAFTFSTYSQSKAIENIVDGSPNNIMITTQPIIKFDATSITGNAFTSVQVQIAITKTFEQIAWEGVVNIDVVKSEGVKPDVVLQDGLYYWRARVISDIGQGNWSDTFTFNINTVEQLPIVDEDSVPMDSSFPSDWNMTEPSVISVYPEDKFSNVPTNLKTVSIVVDQIIPEELIKEDMLTITGYSVDGDDSATAHGIVEGTLNVAYDRDAGITTILFSLADLNTGGAS